MHPRSNTQSHTILFAARTDKEFLWAWARELEAAIGFKVCPDHLLAAVVAELRALRAQGNLYSGQVSETEAAAIRLARSELAQSVAEIATHAAEQEMAREAQRRRDAQHHTTRHATKKKPRRVKELVGAAY